MCLQWPHLPLSKPPTTASFNPCAVRFAELRSFRKTSISPENGFLPEHTATKGLHRRPVGRCSQHTRPADGRAESSAWHPLALGSVRLSCHPGSQVQLVERRHFCRIQCCDIEPLIFLAILNLLSPQVNFKDRL